MVGEGYLGVVVCLGAAAGNLQNASRDMSWHVGESSLTSDLVTTKKERTKMIS